jgi:hypothetical protein
VPPKKKKKKKERIKHNAIDTGVDRLNSQWD